MLFSPRLLRPAPRHPPPPRYCPRLRFGPPADRARVIRACIVLYCTVLYAAITRKREPAKSKKNVVNISLSQTKSHAVQNVCCYFHTGEHTIPFCTIRRYADRETTSVCNNNNRTAERQYFYSSACPLPFNGEMRSLASSARSLPPINHPLQSFLA